MPSRSEHILKAEQNELAVDTNQTQHPEWSVTMLFYAALHYVEAYWADNYAIIGCPEHCPNHIDRRGLIEKHLKPLYRNYRKLEREAWSARYEACSFTEEDVRSLRTNHLEPIKNHIMSSFSSTGKKET